MSSPRKVILECFSNGMMPEECRVVEKELATRVKDSFITTKVTQEALAMQRGELGLSPGDFVVGNAPFIKLCIERAGLSPLVASDYPRCLESLLQRRIWQCTLQDAATLAMTTDAKFYIKPASDIKAFSGEEATSGWLQELLTRFPATLPVSCSEFVDIACEYRVYVAQGRLLATCHYTHPGCERAPLDHTVVERTVATLQASDEAMSGYAIDFCVLKKPSGLVTALMEVNDGTTTGFYAGVSERDYTAMVEARWRQLLS